MKRIEACRKKIDELDRRLLRLLLERTRLAERIWTEKRRLGRPLQDAKREAEILKRTGKRPLRPLLKDDLEAFQSLLIQISKNVIRRKSARRTVEEYKDLKRHKRRLRLR